LGFNEVKNVRYLTDSDQLRSGLKFAQDHNEPFNLIVRDGDPATGWGTTLSKTLRDLDKSKQINVIRLIKK